MSLYDTGIRPLVDAHLTKLSEEKRSYGDYWSASSAGYCYRRSIFERLQIPYATKDARKQRVFSSGHIFHQWIQGITKEAGLSIAQELELQDEELMIRGHVDDLVAIAKDKPMDGSITSNGKDPIYVPMQDDHLILYDYKTAHSKWFEYAKSRPVSYYNKMQIGTYLYMCRNGHFSSADDEKYGLAILKGLSEGRACKISKDDLRMFEYQILWNERLELEVVHYWKGIQGFWEIYQHMGELPPCTCHVHENGFLAKEAFNNYFYEDEPCSEAWMRLKLKERTT